MSSTSTVADVVTSAKALVVQTDTAQVIQRVTAHDAAVAVAAFHELERHFYWHAKDVRVSCLFGRAGLHLGLTRADAIEATDPACAEALRAAAKGLAYDLGSFTWPGWEEAGIELDATTIADGFDAARTNLRLAVELNKPDLPMSRAHWLLGAHQLAAEEYDHAQFSFRQAADLAHRAPDGSREERLGVAYLQLAELLASPADGVARSAYDVSCGACHPEDRSQLATALAVFTRH